MANNLTFKLNSLTLYLGLINHPQNQIPKNFQKVIPIIFTFKMTTLIQIQGLYNKIILT